MKPQNIVKRKIFYSTYKPEKKNKKTNTLLHSPDKMFSPIWGEKKKITTNRLLFAFKNTFCVINIYNFFFGCPGWWQRAKMYI